MKSLVLTLALSFLGGTVALAQSHNTLSGQEQKDGWKLLFDGKTTQGWHVYRNATNGAAWKVTDGELWLDPTAQGRGDFMSDNEYENFELRLDWKIEKGGNSGVIFNSMESTQYKHAWNTGPEMQILDNDGHPDGKFPKHRAGDLYDLISTKKESAKAPMEWNSLRIVSNRGHLELWLNDVLQVETTMFTPEWAALIKGSKFVNHPDFGTYRKGRLMLQDHDHRVWFRNIKIKEL
jgi:hypothetical protein